MPEIVTAKNATEHKIHRWVTEASTLGIRPGQIAGRIDTELGNGKPFVFVQQERATGNVHYAQEFGCISLTVLND